MSKKSKGVILDSTSRYGVGVYEDAKARLKHQTLMQDYEELQRETGAMRSKLEAANQRKLNLAAEVRFLRKRYKCLAKANNMDSSREQNRSQAPNLIKQAKTPKEQVFIRNNEASQHILPLVPEPKKKKQYIVEQVALSNASLVTTTDQARKKNSYGGKQDTKRISTPVSNLNQKEKKRIRKEAVAPNMTPTLDKNGRERNLFPNNDAALRNSTAAFDLNQDGGFSGKEASLPSRAPTFDLNEISTGDEDFQMNVETVMFEEAKRSFTRGIINEEQQNDLKLAVCRNSGESSSRVGKRKISWQDPVALRV